MEISRNNRSMQLIIVFTLIVVGSLLAFAALQGMGSSLSLPQQREVESVVYQVKPLAPHAAKHEESQAVWLWIATHNTDFCRYECGNKTYYGCKVGDRWIFAVEDATNVITAFFTTRDYAIGHTRDNPGCHPYISGAHP